MTTNLSKTFVDDHIQNAAEELVPHKNGKQQVAQYKSAGVSSWIFPYVQCRKEEADSIQGDDECEEFPANFISITAAIIRVR